MDKIEPEFKPADEHLEDTLLKLFNRYAFHQMGGFTEQLARMQSAYKEMWEEEECGPQELSQELQLVGLGSLYNFWNIFHQFFPTTDDELGFIIPQIPFNHDRDEYIIGQHYIVGNIDAVYITTLGANIVKWVYQEPYSNYLDVEYEALLFAQAYHKKTRKAPFDIKLFYLHDQSTLSLKGSNLSAVGNYYLPILRSMEQHTAGTYYARPGLYCRRCPFQIACMQNTGINFLGGLAAGRRKRLVSPTHKRTNISALRRALEV
jgi:hypothetical protein